MAVSYDHTYLFFKFVFVLGIAVYLILAWKNERIHSEMKRNHHPNQKYLRRDQKVTDGMHSFLIPISILLIFSMEIITKTATVCNKTI